MSRHAKERVRPARVLPAWWAVLGLAVVAVAIWAAVHGRSEDTAPAAPGGGTAVHRPTTSMDINGTATLAPAPTTAKARLTAQGAWTKFQDAQHGKVASIPAGTTTYLGLFSENSTVDRLSYVYRLPAHGCTYTFSPPPTPEQCHEWLVLDAKTGAEVAEESQVAVPAP